MKKRELSVDAVCAHEPKPLHCFECACRLAHFAARSTKARETIGANARRRFGRLQECAGQRAP
jgi:hypothetical protein